MFVLTTIARGLRLIATASSFFIFFFGGCILSWIILPLVGLFVRDRVRRARRSQRIMAASWRFFHWWMRTFRALVFRPADTAGQLPPGPCVIVANHPTLVDVTALVSAFGSACIVAKRPMFRSPLVGRILRYGWHIEAATDPIADGARVLEECAERLAQGFPILMFPEGTRSPVGGLGRFKRGALEVAVRANVPVVPFLIKCEPQILARTQAWYTTPAKVPRMTITPLPAMAPETFASDAKAMAHALEMTYTRLLLPESPVTAP